MVVNDGARIRSTRTYGAPLYLPSLERGRHTSLSFPPCVMAGADLGDRFARSSRCCLRLIAGICPGIGGLAMRQFPRGLVFARSIKGAGCRPPGADANVVAAGSAVTPRSGQRAMLGRFSAVSPVLRCLRCYCPGTCPSAGCFTG